MGLITKDKAWVDAENVNYTDLNGNFDTIYNEFNGNITDDNVDTLSAAKITGTAVTLSGDQTITGVKTFNAATKTKLTTDSDGATITFNLDTSNLHTVVLGGNRTLSLSNPDTGQVFVLRLVQDGTGSRTVTWFSGISWPAGVEPTLSTAIDAIDVFGFICTGTGAYDAFIIGQGLS